MNLRCQNGIKNCNSNFFLLTLPAFTGGSIAAVHSIHQMQIAPANISGDLSAEELLFSVPDSSGSLVDW